MIKYFSSVLCIALFAVIGLGFAQHAYAGGTATYTVTTNVDSYTGCSATYKFTITPQSPVTSGYPGSPYDFVPGGKLLIVVTRTENKVASACNDHGPYDNGYIGFGFRDPSDPSIPNFQLFYANSSFELIIPAKPNDPNTGDDIYNLYLYGDVGYGSGVNFHRTAGQTWIRFDTPPMSVNINKCPAGGSYTITDQRGTYTSENIEMFGTMPMLVNYRSQGEVFTLNYTPPAGYTLDSISPASSQYFEVGWPGSFTANCSEIPPKPPAPTVTVDASPSSLSCPANSTISWSSTDATSCTTDWDGVAAATSGSKSVSVPSAGTNTYQVTCTGPGGTRSNSASVSVSAPSCAVPSNIQVVEYNQSTGLQISGGSWTVNPGGHTNTVGETFQVTPAVGGTVYTLTASNLSGYNPSPTVVADGVTGNSFTLLPNGSTKTFAIYYTPTPPPFVYNLSNGGSAYATVGLDSFAQTSITKTKTSGTTQSVTLSVSGAPAGTNPFFDGNGDCSPTCSTNLTFNVAPGMTPGTYPITVTGSPNNMTTTFNLVLNPPPNLTVTCGVTSTGTAKIGIPVTWSATVSGGTGNYTYSWSGTDIQSPGPTTNPFSITYGTVGQKSAQASVVDTVSGQTGTCAAGTVQVNFNPNYKEF